MPLEGRAAAYPRDTELGCNEAKPNFALNQGNAGKKSSQNELFELRGHDGAVSDA
jgi:hypothetical protein